METMHRIVGPSIEIVSNINTHHRYKSVLFFLPNKAERKLGIMHCIFLLISIWYTFDSVSYRWYLKINLHSCCKICLDAWIHWSFDSIGVIHYLVQLHLMTSLLVVFLLSKTYSQWYVSLFILTNSLSSLCFRRQT